LEGADLSRAFTVLLSRHDSLRTLYEQAQALHQTDAFVPAGVPRVFLASTAYNFLNVYRNLSNKNGAYAASENSVHCLEFAREDAAELAFAVLSSRLVYWLWHALGDGFHVTRRFIESIPSESHRLLQISPNASRVLGVGSGTSCKTTGLLASIATNRPLASGRFNYRAFFKGMRTVFAECLRVLQPGRELCVVTATVNQHTDHGLLTFPLATDFAVLLRDLGLVMVNEIIWSKDGTGGKWGSYGAQRPIFGSYPYPPNFLFKNVHEYILVFAKPSKT